MAKEREADRIFKPSLSSSEMKAKNTTRAAHMIVDEEAAARERKTARLRAARLAKETEEQAAPSAVPLKTSRARKPK